MMQANGPAGHGLSSSWPPTDTALRIPDDVILAAAATDRRRNFSFSSVGPAGVDGSSQEDAN